MIQNKKITNKKLNYTLFLLKNYRKINKAIYYAKKMSEQNQVPLSNMVPKTELLLKQLIQTIEDLKQLNENGYKMYEIINITYIKGFKYKSNEEIILELEKKGIFLSSRNYYACRKNTIKELSFLLWFGMTEESINTFENILSQYS